MDGYQQIKLSKGDNKMAKFLKECFCVKPDDLGVFYLLALSQINRMF